MKLRQISSQPLLPTYHMATQLRNLYPLNRVRKYTASKPLFKVGIKELPTGLTPSIFALDIYRMLQAALFIYPALQWSEHFNWRHPFFVDGNKKWAQTNSRVFKSLFTVSLHDGVYRVSSFGHRILQGPALLTAVCTYIYFFSA